VRKSWFEGIHGAILTKEGEEGKDGELSESSWTGIQSSGERLGLVRAFFKLLRLLFCSMRLHFAAAEALVALLGFV